MILFLAFALSIFAQNDKIVLDSKQLITPPAEVKGDFKIATDVPKVEAIILSGLPQEDKSTLWSSWGNGWFASNGKYYAAIGDHRGYDGDSYVYEYDPVKGALRKIIDIAEAIGQKKADYGHGKIHAPILEYQGALYFTTYWGKEREVEEAEKKGYKGSLLFRYDLKTQKLENLGAIAPGSGMPASCLDESRALLYFYAVEKEKGDLLAYDLKKLAVKFKGGSEYTGGYRAFMLAKDGKVFFTNEEGKIAFYDPDKNSITGTSLVLPGSNNSLRAAARSTSDGRIFGMTKAGRVFLFTPVKQTIKDLGPNFLSGDYTAVMSLSADEKYLYFAPGAHGSAARIGTPVVQYQISSGTRKVIAFLRDAMIQKAGYYTAGNYNIQIDTKGEVLYCFFNGAKYGGVKKQNTFGLPIFVTIKIPEAERK